MRLGEMLLPAVFIPAAATVHVLRALAHVVAVLSHSCLFLPSRIECV